MAERAVGRARAGRPRRQRPIRIATAAVVTASALAGLWHLGHRPRSGPAPAASESRSAPPSASSAAPPAALPPAAPSAASPAAAPPELAAPAAALAQAPASGERAEVEPPAPRRASPAVDIDRLLAEARAARVRGDNARARTLYARVARLAAGKPAGAVAEIAIGLLLLERADGGDARAALEAFDRYLAAAPAGALREEAMAGRARALERLGERARAAAAWRELVDEHPRSLQAPLARRRLEALGADPGRSSAP
jgi:hypothetical protein